LSATARARVHAPELFARRPLIQQTKHDAALRAAIGVDPAILAADLGVSERFVLRRQRKLGLRPCRHAPRKADRERDR
jgi:hypothetical protein